MSLARYLSKLAALVGSDGKVPAAGLASGAAVSNIGYTPVNLAGDTVTGPLVMDTTFQNGLRILRNYNVTSGGPAGQSIQFGAKQGTTPVYPVELNAVTDSDGTAYGFSVFFNGGSALTINKAGNLVLPSGKGIDFSANANASGATGEVLDDYERGTWAPVPVVNYGTGSITGYNSSGTYTKIGNMVHIKFEIKYIAWTGSPVNMGVNGLPFTLNAASENYSSGIAQNLSTGNMYQLEMLPGYAAVSVIRRYDNGTAFTNQSVGFDGCATYFV